MVTRKLRVVDEEGRTHVRVTADPEEGMVFISSGDTEAPGDLFTEDQVESAEDDGLASAGLARDDVATRLEFQREVAHEGEVFDAQRRQHGRIFCHS